MGKQEDAVEAVWAGIESVAKHALQYNGATRAAMVRDAALAARYIAGGPQPGSVTVEK